jgi:RNA polymerase sigma-70 factor (sigma-E family)
MRPDGVIAAGPQFGSSDVAVVRWLAGPTPARATREHASSVLAVEVSMREDDRDRGFRQFVSEKSAALLRLAYLLSADRAAAEDVLQIALVRAYLRWGSIESNPEAYVRRVVVTVAADERRRAYRRREVAVEQMPDAIDPTEPFGPVDVTQRLRDALKSLPPRQRAAVVLRHWIGLEPAEVAELLDCSTETVRSQTMRGLDKLRAVYAVEGDRAVESGR